MDLREYIFRKRTNYAALAKEIQISRNYLNSIATGKRIPGIFLARAIELATNGHVTVKELLNTNKEEENDFFSSCE